MTRPPSPTATPCSASAAKRSARQRFCGTPATSAKVLPASVERAMTPSPAIHASERSRAMGGCSVSADVLGQRRRAPGRAAVGRAQHRARVTDGDAERWIGERHRAQRRGDARRARRPGRAAVDGREERALVARRPTDVAADAVERPQIRVGHVRRSTAIVHAVGRRRERAAAAGEPVLRHAAAAARPAGATAAAWRRRGAATTDDRERKTREEASSFALVHLSPYSAMIPRWMNRRTFIRRGLFGGLLLAVGGSVGLVRLAE